MSPLHVPPTEKGLFRGVSTSGHLSKHPSFRALAALFFATSMGIPSLQAGLAYWGSDGFVSNVDSRSRSWTDAFSMTLGVFRQGFTPDLSNREQWAENWLELSHATYDSSESRFAGAVDLSVALPAGFSSEVYFWAKNGDDLNEGPEWLLLSHVDWKWPASSPASTPAVTWVAGGGTVATVGMLNVDGNHLVSSNVAPVPVGLVEWLQSYFPDEPEKWLPDEDPDGDGISNRMEYFLGSLPNDASSIVSPEIRRVSGETYLTLSRNPRAETSFAVEASVDLKKWLETKPEVLRDQPNLIEVKFSGDQSPSFQYFRFKLEAP